MTQLEIIAYLAAPSVIILFGLILILLSQILKPDPYTSPDAPRHLVPASTIKAEELEIIEGVVEDLEAYPQVGRRGRYSAVRNMRVADDWMPYIGDLRVTILLERTAEYLFVRQPVDQLTDPYQRAQWATELATVS